MLDCRHEGIDEAVVIGARDTRVAPAEILGIAETFLVVGADVQNDGQSARRMNSADKAVEREFADGNAEAADALVADAENAFAIGDDDDVDFRIGIIAQQSGNQMAERIGNEEAARAAIDVAEFLAAEGDDGRVNDGQHFIDMVEKKAVEENLVGVLELAEIDVALEVVRFQGKGLIGADDLVVERLDYGRKKGVEAKVLALGFREGGAFVQSGIVEEIHAAKADGADDVGPGDVVQGHGSKIVSLRSNPEVRWRIEQSDGQLLAHTQAVTRRVALDKDGSSLLNAIASVQSREREFFP